MDKLEKVRAEIEKAYNEALNRTKLIKDEYYEGKVDAYRNVLCIFDSIQEEPTTLVWHDASEKPKMNNIIVQGRKDQFAEIVTMIQHTRNEVVRLANASLIDLYWRVGKYISDKISISEWGDGVVKQLADYIERNSPEVKGFSDKNLWRMKQFYETYKDADEKLSAC